MVAVSVLNLLEEVVVIAYLREERSNARGIYWLLREKRRGG